MELQEEAVADSEKKSEAPKTQKTQMTAEERLTGAVLAQVYLKYFRFAGRLVVEYQAVPIAHDNNIKVYCGRPL